MELTLKYQKPTQKKCPLTNTPEVTPVVLGYRSGGLRASGFFSGGFGVLFGVWGF